MNIAASFPARRLALAAAFALVPALVAPRAAAQAASNVSSVVKANADDSARVRRRRYWQRMGYGFATSILAHESGHIAASYAMGFHPHIGMDKARPTIFSGIDDVKDPHKQFLFSAAGLTVQETLDELILDIPHARGGAFEKGMLSGGLATTLFYVSIGRNAKVSDITVMARTSTLSKTQLSMIFGSVAALQGVRIGRNHRYARFFAVPGATGGLKTGVLIQPD